jgi:hypothetical protein
MIKIMKKMLLITSLLWLFPICVDADIIYLKDGTKVRAAKVWEEGDVIRFSLEDYEDIIITYSKEIVERIEKSKDQTASRPTKQKDKDSADQKDVAAGETLTQKGTAAESKKPAEVVDSSKRSSRPTGIDQPTKTGKADMAPQPRVKKPPKTTGVKTDKPAKTPHAKAKVEIPTATIIKKVPPEVVPSVPSSQVDGILFYNPRRPYKYWTGPNTRHHTLKEALAALAKQFDRDPQWVADHLGKTNNLGDIYRNLSPGRRIAPSKIKPVAIPKRFSFYDPRRPYKFWTGTTSKHRTLKQALEALAKQYDRPPEWIKAHMGESNDLGEIHKNLTQSKAKEARD